MVKDTINEFQGSSAETGSSIISYLLRTMTPMLLLVYIYIYIYIYIYYLKHVQ